VLLPELAARPEIRARFDREAQITSSLQHPNIVQVIDHNSTADGTSYLVMEFLSGESLAARLARDGRLAAPRVVDVVEQIAAGLAAAHARGIVHRDLKPDNLYLVPDDRDATAEMVKVLDFGIAKLGQNGSNVNSVRTRTGSVMGTPSYMSPEQCRGTREIDHRTDIYALGVILYEMLCGRPPFVSEGFGEMVHLHISQPPPPPRTFNPSIPEDLERLILWCLAKEPDERMQTMADVHAALTGRPTPAARPTAKTARPQTPAPPPTPTTFTQAGAGAIATGVMGRSRGRRTSAIVVAALALGGAALWLTRGSWGSRPEARVTVAPAPSSRPIAPAVASPPAALIKSAPKVTAAIVSEPAGARVVRERDGAVIGMTPFRETWPSGDGVTRLRLELDGYRSEMVAVPLDRGVDLSFALRKVSAPAEPHKHKDSKRPSGKSPGARPAATARPEPVPL
jgi:serine/threonine-protein kinase